MKWKKCKLLFNIHNELTDILLLSELLMILPHSLAMLSWAKQKLDIGFMLLSFIFFVSVWKNIQVICKKCLQIIAWLCKKPWYKGKNYYVACIISTIVRAGALRNHHIHYIWWRGAESRGPKKDLHRSYTTQTQRVMDISV